MKPYWKMPCIYYIKHMKKMRAQYPIYVGSAKVFEHRMNGHRRKDNTCRSKEIIDMNNYTMKILEETELTGDELLELEQKWMDKYNNMKTYRLVNYMRAVAKPPVVYIKEPETPESLLREKQCRDSLVDMANQKYWILSWMGVRYMGMFAFYNYHNGIFSDEEYLEFENNLYFTEDCFDCFV